MTLRQNVKNALVSAFRVPMKEISIEWNQFSLTRRRRPNFSSSSFASYIIHSFSFFLDFLYYNYCYLLHSPFVSTRSSRLECGEEEEVTRLRKLQVAFAVETTTEASWSCVYVDRRVRVWKLEVKRERSLVKKKWKYTYTIAKKGKKKNDRVHFHIYFQVYVAKRGKKLDLKLFFFITF